MAAADPSELEKIERRLAQVAEKIETALLGDRLFLMHIDRVATQCTWALKNMDAVPGADKVLSSGDTEGSQHPSPTGTSNSDVTSNSETASVLPSVLTPTSMSPLEARELFPSEYSPNNESTNSNGSIKSSRAHSLRKAKQARAEQVRAILSNMKEGMKRTDTP